MAFDMRPLPGRDALYNDRENLARPKKTHQAFDKPPADVVCRIALRGEHLFPGEQRSTWQAKPRTTIETAIFFCASNENEFHGRPREGTEP